MERPHGGRAAGILGWVWIGAGAAKALGLGLYLLMLASAGEAWLSAMTAPPPRAAWLAGHTALLVRRVDLLIGFWAGVGLLLITAGAGLVGRRAWAGVALKVVCGLGIVEAIAVASYLRAARGALAGDFSLPAVLYAAAVREGIWICIAWLGFYVASLGALRWRGTRGRPGTAAAGS